MYPENITEITAIRTILDDDSVSPVISVFSDPDKVQQLELDYLEKLHAFTESNNNGSETNTDIDIVKSEISDLEGRIVKNNEKIIALGGNLI
jgi:hypothetical protein